MELKFRGYTLLYVEFQLKLAPPYFEFPSLSYKS